MSKDDGKLPKEGLRVGDFHIRPAPALSTNDRHDTADSGERARRKEDDAEDARHDGGEATGEASRADAEAAVDASIEEARARASGATEMPILLRDPLTGKVIGEG